MPDSWYRATFNLLLGALALVVAWALATSVALAWPSPAGVGVVSMPTRLARMNSQAAELTTPLAPEPALAALAAAADTGDPAATPGLAAGPTPGPTVTQLPAGSSVIWMSPFASPAPHLPDLAEPGPAAPPRLLVPALSLDQEVVEVPITDNLWDLEGLGQQVGRLATTGAYPGDDLAMTLVGHVRLSATETGPFKGLAQLAEGDTVIYRSSGRDYVYRVVGTSTALPEAVEKLYIADGSRLLLVTCSSWSYFWRAYARRLIVEAELVSYRQSP